MKLSDTQWRHARTWSRQRESIHLRIRAVQRQTAVTAYFSSKQIPPFAFADGLLSRAAIDLCTAKLMALSPAIRWVAVCAQRFQLTIHPLDCILREPRLSGFGVFSRAAAGAYCFTNTPRDPAAGRAAPFNGVVLRSAWYLWKLHIDYHSLRGAMHLRRSISFAS